MPDKKDFGYAFPRRPWSRRHLRHLRVGTSTSLFWMLNTIGYLHWHWKHLGIWQGNVAQFNESPPHGLAARLPVAVLCSDDQRLHPYGMNNLSVWSWMFLFGHPVWATGFMFLISWRGYWQELIETLVWAHERTRWLTWFAGKDACGSVHRPRSSGWSSSLHGGLCLHAAFLIASTAGKFG